MRSRVIDLRSFLLLLITLFLCPSVWSQVVVERSTDRIVISGVTYYLHIVKKGETVYSVSRAYGIMSEELIKENPPAVNGLKEGQNIRIPARLVTTAPPSKPAPTGAVIHDESKFAYHKLQPGETIYYLSKKYSVSEDEIIQSNPGIDINKLPLGYEIAIPRKEFMNEKQDFVSQKTDAYYHKVTKGETMSSIARQYGKSVRELRRANRDIRFPQVGDYLRIPGIKTREEEAVAVVPYDTIPLIQEQVLYLERPSGFTDVTSLRGSFNVAVLLPFYLEDNARRIEVDSSKSAKENKINSTLIRRDDWIYPRSLGFVEMYQGILLAADTLRTLGLNIQIHAYDIKNDTFELSRLIRSKKLDNMDLIIGPVHSQNLAMVASFADTLGIPVVSPVQLSNNSALANNPMVFMATSTLEVAQNAIARKVGEYNNSNIVLIHSDSESEYQDTIGKFRNKIISELSTQMPLEEIRLKDMVFYSRSVFGNDSINRLAHALSEQSGNVIIIASEDAPVMSESLTNIHALSRKYDLLVFGYPGMRYLDNLDHKICFDLGLMVYSTFWIDFSRRNVKAFNSDFRAKFLTEPSEDSYAWQGYDILYYFISGLAMKGKEFLTHPEMHNPELLHTEFDFRRNSFNDGFENEKLFLIRYSNDYELELVNETEAVILN